MMLAPKHLVSELGWEQQPESEQSLRLFKSVRVFWQVYFLQNPLGRDNCQLYGGADLVCS